MTSSSSLKGKLSKLNKEMGALDTFIYLAAKVVGKLSPRCKIRKYYFYCQAVSTKNLVNSQRRERYDTTIIDCIEDLPQDCMIRGNSVLIQRFEQGSTCVILRKDGEFYGYAWLTFGQYLEDEVRCIYHLEPEQTSAWDYDVYVVPKARIGFAFPVLWEALFESMNQRGITQTFSRVDSTNSMSIRSHEKLGAKRTGSALFICLFKLEFGFFSHTPYFSCKTKNRAEITLEAP